MKETASAKSSFLASILKPGEHYAGIILGKNGKPDHHLILLPGEAESVNWKQAKEFAEQAGGELPTRREQSLLFANRISPRFYAGFIADSCACIPGRGTLYGAKRLEMPDLPIFNKA